MERKNTYHKKLYILLNYAIDTIIKLCYYNINEGNTRTGGKTMNKKIKVLAKINYLYSIIWEKATGKDKSAFREESKIHEMLLAAMSAVM